MHEKDNNMNNKIDLPLLETDRLFLTPWSYEYAEDMLLFASNPNVAANGWKIIKTVKQAEKKISHFLKHGHSLEWAIVLKETWRAVGSIGLHLNHNKKELCAGAGYLLAEEYWGKGICAEALHKIVHYAFMGLKVETFNINHKRFNQRSQRVIEKCGFVYYDYSPHTKPNDPNNIMLYRLTREEYYKLNNYPEELRSRDVYRVEYIKIDKNDYNKSITYQKQPNIYQCGQACVAMLAGVSPADAAEAMFEEYGTADCDIDQALNFYRIPHVNLRKRFLPDTILPDICILSMEIPGDLHWSLYYKGKFYDPQFGILDNYPDDCIIHFYWEIYADKASAQRSSFEIPVAWENNNINKKDKLYGKNNPIRKIDSISYVFDYTKGENITGAYCGPAVLAMITGVPFDEIIELMKNMGDATKSVLKKVLDFYGIRYAPKSTAFDPNSPLPDICIIRMRVYDENGKFACGHWGLFFKGIYYDPDWGVNNECPPHVKIFQIWEIYP